MGIRRVIKQKLLDHRIVISRPPGQFNVFPWKLAQLKARGAAIDCVVDGGADVGTWTEEFLGVYPGVTCILVEPRQDAQPKLRSLAQAHKNLHIVQALLGESEGTVDFYGASAGSSYLPNHAGEQFGQVETSQMTTLDRLVERIGVKPPDFIKLDLQGAELAALQGGANTLQGAQFVLLEISLFPFQQGQPIVADMISFMHQRGFELYDISGLWNRPLDGALAQGDFLFLQKKHPLRSDARWNLTG
jgi:FkbM family methyltransferase